MKKFFIFLSIFTLMFATVLNISAASPSDGDLDPVVLDYFTGVVDKLPANTDYVVYSTGAYSGSIVYSSDLDYTGANFSCSVPCTSLTYDMHGHSSGVDEYSSTVTFENLEEFSLSVSNLNVIYSSLGPYASLGNSSKDTLTYILWTVVFLLLIFVVFKFFRNRRHYINI